MKSKLTLLLITSYLVIGVASFAGAQAGSEITKIYKDGKWIPFAKTTTEFIANDDENCLVASTTRLAYSEHAQAFKYNSRSLNIYDNSMELKHQLSQVYNHAERKWNDSRMEDYTYTKNSQLETKTLSAKVDGRWIPQSRVTMTYLREGQVSQILSEQFQHATNDFVPQSKEVFLYDGSGMLISQALNIYNSRTAQFESSTRSKFEYIHNQLAQKTNFKYSEEEKAFVYTDHEEYVYGGDTRLYKVVAKSVKPGTLIPITIGIKEIVYYLSSDDILLLTYTKRDISTGLLVKNSRTNFLEYCKASHLDVKSNEAISDASFEPSIFPNPGQNLNIAIDTENDTSLEIKVFDTTGRLVLNMKENISAGSSTLPVEVQELPNGMYLIHINSDAHNKQLNWLKQ
jgi:Secretion system C-terminal sorting domain